MKRPRGRCVRCGGPRGKRSRSAGECRRCVLGRAAARRQRIVMLEAQGIRPKDIAQVVGTSGEVIRVELWRLRHRRVNTTGDVEMIVNR